MKFREMLARGDYAHAEFLCRDWLEKERERPQHRPSRWQYLLYEVYWDGGQAEAQTLIAELRHPLVVNTGSYPCLSGKSKNSPPLELPRGTGGFRGVALRQKGIPRQAYPSSQVWEAAFSVLSGYTAGTTNGKESDGIREADKPQPVCPANRYAR